MFLNSRNSIAGPTHSRAQSQRWTNSGSFAGLCASFRPWKPDSHSHQVPEEVGHMRWEIWCSDNGKFLWPNIPSDAETTENLFGSFPWANFEFHFGKPLARKHLKFISDRKIDNKSNPVSILAIHMQISPTINLTKLFDCFHRTTQWKSFTCITMMSQKGDPCCTEVCPTPNWL